MASRMIRLFQWMCAGTLSAMVVPVLAAPAGSVIDVVGEVTVTRNAAKIKAGLFDNLHVGDVISIPQGARLVMTHNLTRTEYSLSMPGEFDVGTDDVKQKGGGRAQGKNLTELAVLSLAQDGSKGRRTVGAAHMRGFTPPATVPMDGETILTRTPELSWPPQAGVTGYQLVLKKEDGISLLESTLDKTRYLIESESLLDWGARYQWNVTAEKDGGRSNITRSFRVIDSQNREHLDRIKPGPDGEFSAWVIYAKSLEHLGAFTEARAVWSRLQKMRPDLTILEGLAKGR